MPTSTTSELNPVEWLWAHLKEREIASLLVEHGWELSHPATQLPRLCWQIERFFKALKLNLRIKTFVGTSANAVHIQIWTALIALLLRKHLQFKSRRAWALSHLVALLRWNLFSYRDLWAWLEHPLTTPPQVPPDPQLNLELDSILATG